MDYNKTNKINRDVLTIQESLKKLSRYPIEERLMVLFNESCQFIKANHDIMVTMKTNHLQSWEMETFLLLCILSPNSFASNSFKEKAGNREKIKILNSIRGGMEDWDKYQHDDLLEMIIIALGNEQFSIQHFDVFKSTYKYNYLFNNNDKSRDIYGKMFHSTYDKIVAFLYAIDTLIMNDLFNNNVFKNLFKKFYDIIQNFVIDFDNLVKRQNELIDDKTNYKYCFKLFTAYPIITYKNKVFLPLPHNLITACTESMLRRITADNEYFDKNWLRQYFGKEFEKYLYQLVQDSKIYQYFSKECPYLKNYKTPDVILSDGNSVVFIDTKLSQANVSIIRLNINEIEKRYDQYAQNIKQIYERMKDYPKKFNTFDFVVNKTNMYGIVCVLQDTYISRKKIYEKAFEMIGINDKSNEADYIKSNILICEITDIERLLMEGKDIIPHLENRKISGQFYNHNLIDYKLYNQQQINLIDSFKAYQGNIINETKSLLKEIISNDKNTKK